MEGNESAETLLALREGHRPDRLRPSRIHLGFADRSLLQPGLVPGKETCLTCFAFPLFGFDYMFNPSRQLKTCRCTNLSDDEEGTDGSDDSDDDDDYMDLTSIVDLRNNFGNGNVCKADEGRRCTAENADPMVRTRGFFGDPQE